MRPDRRRPVGEAGTALVPAHRVGAGACCGSTLRSCYGLRAMPLPPPAIRRRPPGCRSVPGRGPRPGPDRGRPRPGRGRAGPTQRSARRPPGRLRRAGGRHRGDRRTGYASRRPPSGRPSSGSRPPGARSAPPSRRGDARWSPRSTTLEAQADEDAVNIYMNPEPTIAVMDSGDLTTTTRREALLSTIANQHGDVLDRLQGLRVDLLDRPGTGP